MSPLRYTVHRSAQSWDVMDNTTGEAVAVFDITFRALAEQDAIARNNNEHTRYANQILADVFGTFAGKRKRIRAKPHRCHDCGKVTKHVRCPDCTKARLNRGPMD